jgi:REP element-mobilizing transposase RayT
MARPLRQEFPGAVWHITARGNERKDIVRSDVDRQRFVDLLGEAAVRYRWIVHSYMLMSNHYHLVIETPEPTLSRGMQWLNGRYAQWFNRQHQRVGHLFQGRFKGILIDKEAYLLAVLRYVALNPVRAKMVKSPEQYRWSSYRAIAGYEPASSWLAVDRVLSLFGEDRAQAQADYRDVINGCEGDPRSPFESVVRQVYLGSEAWQEDVKRRIDSQRRDPRSTSTSREIIGPIPLTHSP